MKKFSLIIILAITSINVSAQAYGNAYYLNRVDINNQNTEYEVNMSNTDIDDDDIHLKIKGLANVKADSMVAIFNVSQLGATVEEVDRLINLKINGAINKIEQRAPVNTYIDMISFVPVYQFEITKKRFSKDSYNEVPAGFELKKNIHIKYSDPNLLNVIIAVLAEHDIFDMVRVDYFSSELESIKKEMMAQACNLMKDRIKNYEDLMMVKLDSNKRLMTDGYKTVLPQEMYKSYQAYSRTSLYLEKSAGIRQAKMAKTHYYQPIVDKEFDFVMNNTIMEPVIQVMYTLNLKVVIEDPLPDPIVQEPVIEKVIETKYILVTPEGALKDIN